MARSPSKADTGSLHDLGNGYGHLGMGLDAHSTGTHDKQFHPTCFALLELSNYSGYTAVLHDWVMASGQLLTDIDVSVEAGSQIHWASAQRGKLKGNIGCAVFTIDDDTDNIHVEIMLIWSLPYVGEDSASVAIDRPGTFTMPELSDIRARQKKLKSLLHKYRAHNQPHSTTSALSLGRIQLLSSFGRAPCKFAIVAVDVSAAELRAEKELFEAQMMADFKKTLIGRTGKKPNQRWQATYRERHEMEFHSQQHVSSLHKPAPNVIKMLRPADESHGLFKQRLGLVCRLSNHTRYVLQVLKCVFEMQGGECNQAVDNLIAPGAESVWSCGATRPLRGNAGVAMFAIGDVAEFMIQWDRSSNLIDSQIGHPGCFSSIPNHEIEKQVEVGPQSKTARFKDLSKNKNSKVESYDVTSFKNLRLSNKLVSEYEAIFELSTSDVLSADDIDTLDQLPPALQRRTTHPPVHHTHAAHHGHPPGLTDFNRLVIDFELEAATVKIVGDNNARAEMIDGGTPVRKVECRFCGIQAAIASGDLHSMAAVRADSLQVVDTFYSHSDKFLVASQAFLNADQSDDASPLLALSLDQFMYPSVTKLHVQTSSLSVRYTNKSLEMLMQLVKGLPAPEAENTLPTPEAELPPAQTESVTVALPTDASTSQLSDISAEAVTVVELDMKPVVVTACNSKLVPLVRFSLDHLKVSHAARGVKLHTTVELDCKMVYHNLDLCAWEPMLEATVLKLDLQQSGDKSLTSVVTDNPIDLNATPSMITSLMALAVDAESAFDDIVEETEQDDRLTYVNNMTGVPISFKVMNATKQGNIHHTADTMAGGSDQYTAVNHDTAYSTVQAVPRQNAIHHKARVADLAALGSREELNVNYIIVRIEPGTDPSVERGQREVASDDAFSGEGQAATALAEWRPLRPQCLSTCGTFRHNLLSASWLNESKTRSKDMFVNTVVTQQNGANYISIESPVLVTNNLFCDMQVQTGPNM